MQVSAIMRSQPNLAATNDPASNGLSMSAYFFETSANVAGAARARPGGQRAPAAKLDAARLGDVSPGRLNTVDMRASKILRFGRFRANVGFNLYNLFNANTGVFTTATNGFNPNWGRRTFGWLHSTCDRTRS